MKTDLLALRVEQLTMATKDMEQAVKNLEKSRLAGKTWFNKKKRLQPETSKIYKGDLVLVHDSRLDKQHTEKLADRWGGPYVVEKVHDGGAYVLKELDGSELKIAVAGNRLKRYWSKVANDETNGDNVFDDGNVPNDEEPATLNSDQPANKE